ncbi:AMP-dependent synthetase/ligase [Fodinibius halophilus]|uniref:Long-chain fatty acid--CoA ligase n=1 Tax=Fodinibius halophilus TaxID=1736908 RepID=A0A6M1TEB0_9BACT|nr:long-chain fatty acid--CoA ligase [Fodinibius halophilus]NGP88522.1 long-chain fatty acid--CoA ligase [Fodinibius halophilus]
MGNEHTTIISEIDAGLRKHDKEVLIATKRNGKWVKTGRDEFQKKVRNFALGLYQLGVREGDKVSVHSENSAEWVICDQAILSIGAANVPIYTTQPGDQVKYILENSGAKVHIVSTDKLFKDTKPLMKGITNVEAVISIFGSKHDKLKSFDAIMEMGAQKHEEEPELFEQLKSKVKPDDLATLIYTSGTTGDPKGVMLTHNNIASNIRASLERVPFDEEVREDERMLSYLPLSHVFERMITYLYLHLGYPIYYIEEVEEIRDDFEYVKPYYLATVPRLLEKIHTGVKVKGQELSGLKKQLYYWALHRAEEYDPENPPSGLETVKHKIADKLVYSKIRELFGGNLLGVVSGGAALSPNLFRFMNAIGFICLQGYGLTETSPVLSVQDKDHLRVGSSGFPLSNVDIKIAEDGEILAKGPNVMEGYYNNPEKTDEVFTDDGWFMTGDVGKLEDNYLFITDRKKSVFKLSTGKYIAPQIIENKLIESGFIDQAVVIGYQRKFCSALIVPSFDNVEQRLKSQGKSMADNVSDDPKVRKLIQDEVDKVNKELSPWETVKKFVLLDAAFSIESDELTPTQKVKRPVVKEHYSDEIESMYEEEGTESQG